MTAVWNIWRVGAQLGEGPVWDWRDGCLWFVDIKRMLVHRYEHASGRTESWGAPAQVGWVLPAEGGGFVAGLKGALSRFDPIKGEFIPLVAVEPDHPGNRLNDATVHPDGSVWFGTMDDSERCATGRFHRYDGEHVTEVAIPPVAITNGPAVSADGRILYHVDTLGGLIFSSRISAGGQVGATRMFVRIDPAHGHPDGVTVDAAGNVWVGLWGGWCARCYAPDGTLIKEVKLPAANVTKIAFGGADLMTAYVTTASIGLSSAELFAQPMAGSLFAFQAEIPGIATSLARCPSALSAVPM